jgi:DNA-binding IclR family transcriptional regulator
MASIWKAALSSCNCCGKSYLETHPLDARTRKIITQRDELLREFDRIRARGDSIDDGEFDEGLRFLAVPVEDLSGRFVQVFRFDSNFDRYLETLRKIARVS